MANGIIVFGIFALLAIIGAPILTALGIAGLVGTVGILNLPGTVMPQGFFSSVDSWPLLCTPFFLLSGAIMGKCGPATALFDMCEKFLGHIRGGLAIAVVVACAFFGAITGSGIATAVAIGSMAVPEMLKAGYDKKSTYGLVAVSGTLGLMIPPSIYMIIFAGMVSASVVDFFTAGYLPGIMIAAMLIVIAVVKAPKETRPKYPWPERWKALKNALPALGMPIVVMGSIYTGIFTATESAALSILYCVVICPLFYRNKFTMKAFIQATKDACKTTSQIYLILGAVAAFSSAITYMKIPQSISTVVVEMNLSPTVFMIGCAIVYLIFGMFIDVIPILYLTVPIFYPVTMALGINTLHFMIMTIVMTMVAQVSPPFGVILFAMTGTFKEKIEVVIRGALPYIAVLLAACLAVIFIPQLSTVVVDMVLY